MSFLFIQRIFSVNILYIILSYFNSFFENCEQINKKCVLYMLFVWF